MKGQGELIGIAVALLILVLAFGSVVGSGLPVAVALVGLGVGSAGITLLAGVMDVSTSAPTVAIDGRAGCRDRLRAAPGHPARGVPPRGPREARGGGTRGRDRRSLRGVRVGHRAGLPARPEAGRAADLRLLRVRHRDRRRRGRPRGAHAGSRPVRAGRQPAAPPPGAPRSRAHRRAGDGSLGHPRQPSSARLGAARRGRAAHARGTRPGHAHLAAGLLVTAG